MEVDVGRYNDNDDDYNNGDDKGGWHIVEDINNIYYYLH